MQETFATRTSPRPWRELSITTTLTVLAVALLISAGWSGWTGREDGCLVNGQCFCERDRGGLVRQPANTASNLGFVAAGLGIALALGIERQRGRLPRPGNPMTETRFYPGFYAALVALLGPGSMALHASLTWWGSVLDLVSMNAFISFLFLYAWKRWRGLSEAQFVLGYLALNLALLGVKLGYGKGSGAFGLVALASLAIEVRLRRVRGDGTIPAHGDLRWLLAGVAVFATGFIVWLLAQNDGWLCHPDSLLQGHGFWHMTGAGAALCLYLYMRSERPRPDERRERSAAA